MNLSYDGPFIATNTFGVTTRGEQMGSDEMQTLQFAVPPLISGP